MDLINNIRITSFKKNNIDWFRDFYISILLEREIIDSKKEFKQNRINQFWEPGYIFAPYIPIMMTPIVYEVPTGLGKSEIMSRYAKTQINENYYGRITMD